jgi:membrane protease YdiL (CAAX protease family)
MNRKTIRILLCMLLFCLSMALLERVIQPGYLLKSLLKITLCLGIVVFCGGFGTLFRKDGLLSGLILGGGIYAVILGAFLIFRGFIDLDAIAAGILGKEGISRENFLWVALYISFGNSLLEEFLFRGIAYLQLRRYVPEQYALCFSSLAFAGYHVAILDGWFTWWIYLLCMVGLFLGGLIFDLLDRRGSILPSWLAHMGADLAINTIGLMMYGLI